MRSKQEIREDLEIAESALTSAQRNAGAFSPQSLGLFYEACERDIARLRKELAATPSESKVEP